MTAAAILYVFHEAMPLVAIVMVLCYAKSCCDRAEIAMRLHMERLADAIRASGGRVEPESETESPVQQAESLPRAFLVRDGSQK